MEWSFKHGFLESVHGFLEITSCNCSQPDQIHIEPLYTSNCHGSRWAGNCFQENVCLSDSQSSSNWFQRLIFGFDQKNINSKLHPAPHEVLILLVLLVSWMEDPPEVQSEYDVLEFFAGVGRIARLSEKVGMKSVAYDIDYGNSRAKQSGKRSAMDLNSSAGLVLAIKLILRSSFNHCISISATCCSSWVPVNRGTGLRDLLVPMGNEFVVSVRKANKMVSRNLVPSELLKFSYIPWKGFFFYQSMTWIPHWSFARTKECDSHGFDDLCWWNNSFGESLQQPDRPPWQVCLDGEDVVGAWRSGFLAKKSPRLREYNENQIFLELKIVRDISNRIHFMIHLRCSKSPSGWRNTSLWHGSGPGCGPHHDL